MSGSPWLGTAALGAVVMAATLAPRGPPQPRERILITGGNGYLAQHLIRELELAGAHDVAYTVRCEKKRLVGASSASFVVSDLATDAAGLSAAVEAFQPTVLVHAAAQSSPKACELDVAAATAANAPRLLLATLGRHAPDALVVYVSTDQVYDGAPLGHAPYADGHDAKPRNAYGSSKLAFEAALQEEWPFHVVLRASNMVGPRAPFTGEGKFAQWVASELRRADGARVRLFADEWRSFVAVGDVVRAVLAAVRQRSAAAERGKRVPRCPFNCGGPERLSRVDLGNLVADALRVDRARIEAVSASSVDVGYDSPPDLAMASPGLAAALGLGPATPVGVAVDAACAELIGVAEAE